MQTYGKIFRKVIAGFLALYIVMMGIFTFSKQEDVRSVYRNKVFDIKESIVADIQNEYKHKNEEGDRNVWTLNEQITRDIQYNEEFKIYGATAVYKKGELLHKSGYYLVGRGVDWYLEERPDSYKYIDLEKWLSKDELIEFIQIIREAEMKSVEMIWLKADGYAKGDEVLPTNLEIYKIKRREGENVGWHDEDAVLTKAYKFEPQIEEEMIPYSLDNWDLVIPLEDIAVSYQNLEPSKEVDGIIFTRSIYERLKQLEEDMYNWRSKESGICYSWENENGWCVRHFLAINVETETEPYFYRVALEYEPWVVAIGDLKLVYLFSALMVLVMSLILTYGLWRTEKKQQLLEKNRRMLIDAIGHELKTPLGIIGSYSEGLKEKIAEDKREHYLDVIIDETHRMNQLILEMLALSKLESGAYKLKLEQFKISDLMKSCLKNKEKLFEDGQIQLDLQLMNEIEIKADYSCMEKVINNILMNAIYHTPINGKLTIKLEGNKVSIENEGEHIPKEKLKEIWTSFYKVEDVQNRSGKGTGLGLAIVKGILELHGMQYGAYNTGSGVCFWFQIK